MENKEPAFLPEEHALVYHDQSFQGISIEGLPESIKNPPWSQCPRWD